MILPDTMVDTILNRIDENSKTLNDSAELFGMSDWKTDAANGVSENVYSILKQIKDRQETIETLIGIEKGEDDNGKSTSILKDISNIQSEQLVIAENVLAVKETQPTLFTLHYIGFAGLALNLVVLVCVLIKLFSFSKKTREAQEKLANDLQEKVIDKMRYLATEEETKTRMSSLEVGIDAKISDQIQFLNNQINALKSLNVRSRSADQRNDPQPQFVPAPLPPENGTFREVVDALRDKAYPLQRYNFDNYISVCKIDAGLSGNAPMTSSFSLVRTGSSGMCKCFTVSRNDRVYLYPNDPHISGADSWLSEYFSFESDKDKWTPAQCRWEGEKLILISKGVMPRFW